MAYSAKQTGGGLYQVLNNGQPVATGTSDILQKYGLSVNQLAGGDPGATPKVVGIDTPSVANLSSVLGADQPAASANPAQALASLDNTNQTQQYSYIPYTPFQTPTQNAQQTTAQTPTTPPGPAASGTEIQGPATAAVQTPEQSAALPSSYTTRAQLANLMGIPNYSGTAAQNQQLAQRYQQFFSTVQGTEAPNQYPRQQITQATTPVQDPISSAMTPIMNSLSQVVSEINNSTLTGMSLQQEYNQLALQYNLPQMQSDLMNMQTVMNGTEQDIRDEISKSGGFATDSQVLGMTAARNKVIMKQYNALATQYDAAQQNVQNMMQYASTDQSTQLQRENMAASITESLASIESNMMSMGMTMQNHASDNLNKIVTNVGYTGLAAQAQDNPQMLSYYENLLNLAPGTLSDTNALSQMETYRQQQLALGQQKVQISVGNASSLNDYRQVMEDSRYSTIASNTIRQMYQSNKNPIQIYNSSSPILSRIDAALPMALDPKNKNKAAPDLDLVDAYVQIARGGQNITESQVETLLGGLGISAKFDVASQKITGTAILDNGTRQSLADLSKGIVANQKKQANVAVDNINNRLSAISGFPTSMLLQSPADIQLYQTGDAAGTTFTSDSGSSYTLPY